MTLPAYTLHRSSRRTVAIHVHDGRVEVRAPMRAAQRDIDAFVQQKSPWILKKLAELRDRTVENFRVDDGCLVDINGEKMNIYWQAAARGEVKRERDELWICGRALDEGKARRLFLRWLVNHATENLLPQAQQRIESMGLSEHLTGFTLRYTRSLWGRCSARGNILFNPLILLAPLPVIDYLIVHEACHLRHMNHSRAFWTLVASHCPDWQASRYWLKKHGHRLRVG
jgi:predicted metal-dependent hydrolase